MMPNLDRTNVYFFSLYLPKTQDTASGLTCALCAASAKARVRETYPDGKYLTIRQVPELEGVSIPGSGIIEICDR